MNKPKIGIVGAGGITSVVHIPVLKGGNLGEIAWVADVEKKGLARVSDAYGVPAILVDPNHIELPEVDIALLATPLYAREQYLEYFSQRGTAALCEKPFAASVEEHRRYLALPGGDSFYCGYMRRAYKAIRVLRKMVEENWFGPLKRIEFREGARSTRGSGTSRTLDLSYKQGGGVLRDLGCHGLDAILFISNAHRFSIEQVDIEWDSETDRHVDAKFFLMTRTDETDIECSVDFTVSWLAPQSKTMEVHFEDASIRVGTTPDQGLSIRRSADAGDWIPVDFDLAGATTSYQAFYLEWRDVVDAIRTKSQCDYDAGDSVLTTELVEAIYRAGETAQ